MENWLRRSYLNIDTFNAGFMYIFSVTAYNELGSINVQCDPVTHHIGMCRSVSACESPFVYACHFPPGIPHVPNISTGKSNFWV